MVTSQEWLSWIFIPVFDSSIFDINKLQRCWHYYTRSRPIFLFWMTKSLADSHFHWAGEHLAWCTWNINWKKLKFIEYRASVPLVLHHTQAKKAHYGITPIRNRNLDNAFLTYMKTTFFEKALIWTSVCLWLKRSYPFNVVC